MYVDVCVKPRFYMSVFYSVLCFFFLYYCRSVNIGSVAHQLFYSMGTGVQGHFMGAKWPEHESDLLFPSNAKFNILYNEILLPFQTMY